MKAGIAAPVYLSTSWVLTVSYQLFTDTAVRAVSDSLNSVWPTVSVWLNTNLETIVFVYAFTWLFVLSSVIPSVILGRERSVLVQYIVVLVLTLLAFSIKDILLVVSGINLDMLLNAATLLNNPILACVYLAVPYIVMVGLDAHSRRTKKKSLLKAAIEKQAPPATSSAEKAEAPEIGDVVSPGVGGESA
jgi:hypothetical protein